jgi:trk system potassium uptake protein TrkH
MKIVYKNSELEKWLIGVNAATSVLVVAALAMQFGFEQPLLPLELLAGVQMGAVCVFAAEKLLRLTNAVCKRDFLLANWFAGLLLLVLAVVILSADSWFADADYARLAAVAVYLLVEVVTKVCKGGIAFACSGQNPARSLLASFLVLIFAGTSLLMLPKSTTTGSIGAVDALFTATSATCVTGLIVKDTGKDFSAVGQLVILVLIQLGGLGIVIFGAVIALLVGRALSLRESATMQDLLSAQTLGRMGRIIAFILLATVAIETAGALATFNMWDDVPGWLGSTAQQWFCSIFHSISAFCNAGFGLFSDSLAGYRRAWPVYVVICPLIILGGFGFGVLYNVGDVVLDRINGFFRRLLHRQHSLLAQTPKRLQLQTKIVLTVSGLLIILGAAGFVLLEYWTGSGTQSRGAGVILDGLFQSVTARTAGFNTVDVGALSAPTQMVLILLMFIGGSPASTAGGIKTVTFAVVIMAAYATLRKRSEVEIFRRSVRMAVVGKAVTIALLFVAMLIGVSLALSVSESANRFEMSQIIFEVASALGTVGLSTGITPALTAAGKLLIIATMLIGKLGPLTLLASLMLDTRPVRYNYPEEAVVVG